MKTMKKLLAAVLATVMLLGVTACGNKNDTPAADGDNTGTTSTTVLKMGHVYSETYPMHLAMLAMADEVYEKTEGRYKIEIHANSSLGNESDLNEGVNIGTVDMAFTATTPLANIWTASICPISFRTPPMRMRCSSMRAAPSVRPSSTPSTAPVSRRWLWWRTASVSCTPIKR